jgi:predicted Rossmann fold nucleotide-binding protein DprA/Smf involved in DNA uptake
VKRVAIVGGREFHLFDAEEVRAYLRTFLAELPAGSVIVSGGAKGVDSMAEDLAKELGLQVAVHKPDKYLPPTRKATKSEFKNACLTRDRDIVDDAPDGVLAIPGPYSTGTYYTAKYARTKGRLLKLVDTWAGV